MPISLIYMRIKILLTVKPAAKPTSTGWRRQSLLALTDCTLARHSRNERSRKNPSTIPRHQLDTNVHERPRQRSWALSPMCPETAKNNGTSYGATTLHEHRKRMKARSSRCGKAPEPPASSARMPARPGHSSPRPQSRNPAIPQCKSRLKTLASGNYLQGNSQTGYPPCVHCMIMTGPA